MNHENPIYWIADWIEACGAETGHFINRETASDLAQQVRGKFAEWERVSGTSKEDRARRVISKLNDLAKDPEHQIELEKAAEEGRQAAMNVLPCVSVFDRCSAPVICNANKVCQYNVTGKTPL